MVQGSSLENCFWSLPNMLTVTMNEKDFSFFFPVCSLENCIFAQQRIFLRLSDCGHMHFDANSNGVDGSCTDEKSVVL